jgi:Ca-activated chloride channel family protein
MLVRARPLLVLPVVLGSLTSLDADQSFRAGVAAVHLPVIVTDREGEPIRGLSAADFEIREAGRPQVLSSFAEGPPGPAVPLHLALMFDTSESMERELDLAARLGVGLVDGLSEAADVTLVEFDATVRVSRFEPPSYPRLIERLRRRELGQRTMFFDALGRYIALVRERPGQHLVVICTDGVDSASGLGLGDAVNLVRLGDVIVYAVGYLNELGGSDRGRQQGLLTGLARETGGDAYFPSGRSDLDRIVGRIRAEIEARYTLGYVPTRIGEDDRFHRVEVRLTRPDLKGVRVRTRSGYLVEAGQVRDR